MIVLAGGHSRRFGSDKLAARIEGTASLTRVVARVEPLASEVIVSTSSVSRQRDQARLLPRSVRFLVDRPRHWGDGPAGAMARALEESAGGPVLFVPGDMPWVETRALRRFVGYAGASGAEVAAPVWESGGTEHLVQWHRSGESLLHIPDPGTKAPPGRRASEYLRALPRTLLVPVSLLSDRPQSFSHLTVPADIYGSPVRGDTGPSAVPRVVAGTPKRRYREAHAQRTAGELGEAARAFAAESQWYTNAHLPILARHAEDDATRLAGRTAGNG